MAEQKDRQLRLIVGILLVLAGLPSFSITRMMMPMMSFIDSVIGYGGMSSNIIGIVFLVTGIWLIIDASKK